MKSDAYWANRANKRMYDYQKEADKTANEITQAYIKSTEHISDEIHKIFATFQTNGKLTETEAKKLLNNLPEKADINNLKSVIKTIKDPVKRQELLNIINSPAYAYRIKRLERLQQDIDVQTSNLAQMQLNSMDEHLVSLANEAYNRSIFDIQKGTGIGFSFARMPTSRIKEILRNNWSGQLFSERIWGNAEDLNTKLKQELMTGFMTGRSYKKTAEEIQSKMAVGAMEARRLVRTESTYIANAAEIESYKECGIEKFKFVATFDMRTSTICAAMDRKVFDVDKAVAGSNVPPLHPWCRSTTVAVIDGIVNGLKRRANDPITGKSYEIPYDTTYAEWKKSIDERHGEGTFDKERKKVINKNADKEQYIKYKRVLGNENLPETFDKFQKLKYNDSKAWNDLKGFKKYKKHIPNANINNYKLYSQLKEENLIKGHVVPYEKHNAYILEDLSSKRDPAHIMKCMYERHISDDDVQKYIDNALFVEQQFNGTRMVYYSENGVTVLTKTSDYKNIEWIAKTTWNKHDFDEKTVRIMEVAKKYV